MSFVILGITVGVALLIFTLSHLIRKYCIKKISDGFEIKFLSEAQVKKTLKVWKYANIAFVGLVLLMVISSYLNAVYGLEKNISQASNVPDKTFVMDKNIQEPTLKALDQETYFYCLDKASGLDKGLTPEIIKACEAAATNYVIKRDTPVEEVEDYYVFRSPMVWNKT